VSIFSALAYSTGKQIDYSHVKINKNILLRKEFKKGELSRYTPWRRLGGGGIAPTYS
jgi:hypothetical protein